MTMQRIADQKRCLTGLRLIAVVFVFQMAFVWPAWALTPKQQFYRAENAAAALKKNTRHQKYRDKWLACIEKYKKVYQLDPSGPWAAAGLYNAGLLYLDLAKRSYLTADRQEALDLFQRVIQRFPKSRYTPKAKTQLDKLNKPAPTPGPSPAEAKFKTANAVYKRLMGQQSQAEIPGSVATGHRSLSGRLPGRRKRALRRRIPVSGGGTVQEVVGNIETKKRPRPVDGSFSTGESALPRFGFTPKKPMRSWEVKAAANRQRKRTPAIPWPESSPKANLHPIRPRMRPSPCRTVWSTVNGLRFWSTPQLHTDRDRCRPGNPFLPSIAEKGSFHQKAPTAFTSIWTGAGWARASRKSFPSTDELLADARAGQNSPETVRIVVDIKSFKTYKIFSLKNPFRIVLDVWGLETETATAEDARPEVRPRTGKLPPGAIARQLALGVKRIVIDPGHGGRDYGAPGYLKGVHEKDVVLQIAKRLARKVESDLNCDAVLTRTTDRYLTLEERTAIANTQNADLFISIHTNAIRDKRAYGIETFFLNLATDDDAIMVAARENATSAKNISDLESILNDLMQNAKISESSRLAAMVQREMCSHLKKSYSYVRNKGVKQAPFYVLLGAQMPALLVETSFISNPRECKRLTDAKYQDQLCDGIIRGIRKYIKETSPTAFMEPSDRPTKNG